MYNKDVLTPVLVTLWDGPFSDSRRVAAIRPTYIFRRSNQAMSTRRRSEKLPQQIYIVEHDPESAASLIHRHSLLRQSNILD